MKKELIEINDEIFINETDVSTLEYEKAQYAGYHGSKIHSGGTIIIMKSGRKVFAEGLTPKQVYAKLGRTEISP